jgi:hypothetical protein
MEEEGGDTTRKREIEAHKSNEREGRRAQRTNVVCVTTTRDLDMHSNRRFDTDMKYTQ